MLSRMGRNHSDMFGTPEWPVHGLIEFIYRGGYFQKRGMTPNPKVWEPACGKGRMVEALEQSMLQCDVKGTDIQGGYDFLTMEPLNFSYEMIITNPPFSLKDAFLKRCYDLKVPFALLLPLTALSGKARIELYKEHGMQLLMLPKRIDFEYEDGGYKGKPWFSCAWFTNGFELPKDINYL